MNFGRAGSSERPQFHEAAEGTDKDPSQSETKYCSESITKDWVSTQNCTCEK